MKLTLILLALTIVCRPSFAETATTLTVIDEANKSHSVDAADIAKLPRVSAKATSHQQESEFEGVLLSDVLKSTGVKFGDALKGKRAATVVVLEAPDAYQTALSLLEVDPDTTDKKVILADHRDGKPLDEKEGPYRLVIPGDKRPIRWIRMVRTLRVLNLRDLKLESESAPKK